MYGGQGEAHEGDGTRGEKNSSLQSQFMDSHISPLNYFSFPFSAQMG